MQEQTLAQAVARFAALTYAAPDEMLERDWEWSAYKEGVRFAFFRTYEQLCQLAATLATLRAAQGPPITTAQRALAQYHAAFRDLQALLIGVTDDTLDCVPTGGEWKLRVILGHTIAVKKMFFACIHYAMDQHRQGNEQPNVVPDEYVEALAGTWEDFERTMDNASLAGILDHYAGLHTRILRELADIREDELGVPSPWWEGYPLPIQFRLHRFNSHLRQHTIQIEKTLETLGRHSSEILRLLRLLYRALGEIEGVTIGAEEIGAEQRQQLAAEISARAYEIATLINA